MRAEPAATATLSTAGRTGEVAVWSVDLERPAAEVAGLERRLPADERVRAARFAFGRDRRRFVVCRSALRAILAGSLDVGPGDVTLAYGERGKPRLADDAAELEFNVAHTGELALIALARGFRVGVDVELVRPLAELDGLAETAFAPGERARLRALPPARRTEAFFACWTRKEAFVKAVGDGVPFGLDRFEVSLAPDEPPALLRVADDPAAAERWSIAALEPAPGHVGALAVERSRAEVRARRWPEGGEW